MARPKKPAPMPAPVPEPAGGPVKPTQYRLDDDTLALLDAIADHHGLTRTDAIRIAAREAVRAMCGPGGVERALEHQRKGAQDR